MSCRVQFSVTVDSLPGEQVVLVGDVEELGNWDVGKGCFLDTTSSAYPVWTKEVVLPANRTIQYKYVIIDAAKDTPPDSPTAAEMHSYQALYIHWEDPPFVNRLLDTGCDGSAITVNDGMFGLRSSTSSLLLLSHKGSLHSIFGECKCINVPPSRWKDLGFGMLSSGNMVCAALLAMSELQISNIMDTPQLASIINALHSHGHLIPCITSLFASQPTLSSSAELLPWQMSTWIKKTSVVQRQMNVALLRSVKNGHSNDSELSEDEKLFLLEESAFRECDMFVQWQQGNVRLEHWRSVWNWQQNHLFHSVVVGGDNLPWAICIPTIMKGGGPFGAGERLLIITFDNNINAFPAQYADVVRATCQQIMNSIAN